MSLSLPIDIQQRIDAQLATGAFASAEAVLRDALESLERRQNGVAHLRALVSEAEEDVAAGRVGHFDRDAIKQSIRAQLAERGIRE